MNNKEILEKWLYDTILEYSKSDKQFYYLISETEKAFLFEIENFKRIVDNIGNLNLAVEFAQTSFIGKIFNNSSKFDNSRKFNFFK